MTCLLSNGAIFYHIPKTGGTWVFDVLQELGLVKARLGHVHADFFHAYWNRALLRWPEKLKLFAIETVGIGSRRYGQMPDNPYSFCFVREPLAWYESYWNYMQAQSWPNWGDERDPKEWHPCSMLNGLRSDDFGKFMQAVISKRPGFVTELFSWYTTPSVNFVGHQESLAADLSKVLDALGVQPACNLTMKRRTNESRGSAANLSWDPPLARDVIGLEAAAYRRYGYSAEQALERVKSKIP